LLLLLLLQLAALPDSVLALVSATKGAEDKLTGYPGSRPLKDEELEPRADALGL
jgi:hypothetical protein